MRKLLKVCGMTDGENIREVESLGIDLMGFIFYEKSPRCVHQLPDYLPQQAQRVGVFVDANYETIMDRASAFGLTFVQLHGHETPSFCAQLQANGLRVIKAFSIAEASDLEPTGTYHGTCDYFLFDTKTATHGGSGQRFDWKVLAQYQGPTPFLLSGGIGLDSLEALHRFSHPALIGYDLNSRFETSPGVKDVEAVKLFTLNIKH